MKWIKASERLPEFNKRVSLKWKGVPYIGQFVKGHKEPLAEIDRRRTYLEESFVYIEWLDESPDPYREALEKIAKWELPATGKFWDEEKARPVSFEAAYGSNGAREYMRSIARAALGEKEVGNEAVIT